MRIIIRKPKFMRNDEVMRSYLIVAATITKEACRPDLSQDARVDSLAMAGGCMKKAAKAGGFMSVKDMIDWAAKHK